MMKIISPGIYSSVQDKGRRGYRQYGMPISGAVDLYAFECANKILGNKPDAAEIEITGAGFECRFLQHSVICITGADINAVNSSTGNIIKRGIPVEIVKDEQIKFTGINKGLRGYLAVRGGISIPEILGSRSMLRGQKLKTGDVLNTGNDFGGTETCMYDDSYISIDNHYIIKVRKGPDAGQFPRKLFRDISKTELTVSNYHDRMGIRLNKFGSNIEFDKEMITKPVFPGCIQLTSGGVPIIIMNDGQTTGGYPVFIVIEMEDMRIAGQLKAGDKVKFVGV